LKSGLGSTVAVSVIEGGFPPGSAVQLSVYVVSVVIGLDTKPAGPEESAVHESPFPVTVHDEAFETFQYTRVDCPSRTSSGFAIKLPVVVAVGTKIMGGTVHVDCPGVQ
jgi:hypothetical protein